MLIMASSKEEAQAHLATAMPSLDSSGVYPQPRQECSNTHSEGDFLGVLPGFMYHADLLANSQNPIHTTLDQRDPSPGSGNYSQDIPTPGLNGIHSSSSFGSSTALPPLGESQDYSTKTQSQLQPCSDNLRHEVGSNLVAPRTPKTQWQVDADNAVGHGNRIRCIDAGLGSKVSTTPAREDHGHHTRGHTTSITSSYWQHFWPSRPLPLTHTTRQFF